MGHPNRMEVRDQLVKFIDSDGGIFIANSAGNPPGRWTVGAGG